MESIWIATAFLFGLIFYRIGLPPLIGYLVAGFVLNTQDVSRGEEIHHIAHFGVLLLLFSVGLKINLKRVLRIEVCFTTFFHFGLLLLICVPMLIFGRAMAINQALIIGAVLGFSSTVLAVKSLEDRREIGAFHGRMAIGILIIQDLIAILLLTLVSDTTLSPWAALIIILPLFRPLLYRLMDHSGHGEIFVLTGVFLAVVVGGAGFESVGLNSELGALMIGALLANHPKATELSGTLWSLKEILLVGFFLQIGMSGLPSWDDIQLVAILIFMTPLKMTLFFIILVRLKLRARSAFLSALSLATFSEFALIVGQMAVETHYLPSEWLPILSLSVALSFVIFAPLNRASHAIYERWSHFLISFERHDHHPDELPVRLGMARILVVGMGKVGCGAYQFFSEHGGRVVGMDSDPDKVEQQLQLGRRVVFGDVEDPSIWAGLDLSRLDALLLAMPDLEAKRIATQHLRGNDFKGLVCAISGFPEHASQLIEDGADLSLDFSAEAGVGFAEHVWESIHQKRLG